MIKEDYFINIEMGETEKNNRISCYLKDFFNENNISQKEIQDALKVSQQYVSGFLNGKRSIGKKLAEKLHNLYGVDKTILLTGEFSKEENPIIRNTYKDFPVEVVKILQEQNMAFNAIQTIQDRKIEILTKNIELLKEEVAQLKSLIKH